MSTYKITEKNLPPFPCWLFASDRNPPRWMWIDATWPNDFVFSGPDAIYQFTHYSTLPESQRPEGVPTDSAHGFPKSCLNEGGSAVAQAGKTCPAVGIPVFAPLPSVNFTDHTLAGQAMDVLMSLTNEQRIEIFSWFCRHCGSPDAGCQCRNDE